MSPPCRFAVPVCSVLQRACHGCAGARQVVVIPNKKISSKHARLLVGPAPADGETPTARCAAFSPTVSTVAPTVAPAQALHSELELMLREREARGERRERGCAVLVELACVRIVS